MAESSRALRLASSPDMLIPEHAGIIEDIRLHRKLARTLAKGSKTRDQLGFARGFTVEVIRQYWAKIQAGFRLAPLPDALDVPVIGDEPTLTIAKTIGNDIAKLPPSEAGYFLGTTYTATLPDEFRAEHGIFYTPPSLTDRILDLATSAGVDWSQAKVLDPACGGGAFLAPVAQRMVSALRGCEPAIILQNISARLKGFEIDPFGAWMTQVTLEAALLDVCRAAGRRLPRLVEIRNSLSVPLAGEHLEAFDLVVGNPPYGRITLPDDMRALYGRSLYGHANLYGVFTDLALRLARQGGVISLVMPASFLGGEYFKNLRRLLAKEAAPVTIEFIEDRKGVFADALQEATLATFRKDGRRRAVQVGHVAALETGAAQIASFGKFRLPDNSPAAPWILPRTREQSRLVHRLASMPDRLSTYGYKVSTGPLVWNRHKPQLSNTPSKDAVPIVWAEAITQDGRFVYRAQKRNHALWFHPRENDGALIVREACVLVQRTTAKEQARRLIAAEMPASFVRKHGGAAIENHVNMVRGENGRTTVSAAAIAALLNSSIVDQVFRCLSGSVAVSANEIEAIPLPNPAQMKTLEKMIEAGADREEIDRAITEMYHVLSK